MAKVPDVMTQSRREVHWNVFQYRDYLCAPKLYLDFEVYPYTWTALAMWSWGGVAKKHLAVRYL